MSNDVAVIQQVEQTKPPIDLLREHIANVEKSVAIPGVDISNEIKNIHAVLKASPEVSFILTDDEVGKITQAFAREGQIVFNSKPPAKAKASAVNVKQLSVDDI